MLHLRAGGSARRTPLNEERQATKRRGLAFFFLGREGRVRDLVGAHVVGDANDEHHRTEEEERQKLQACQRQDRVKEAEHQKDANCGSDLEDAEKSNSLHERGSRGSFRCVRFFAVRHDQELSGAEASGTQPVSR